MNNDHPGSQSFYLALAANDRAAANGGVLANVRHKHLTSAATWEGLASLAGRTAKARKALAIHPQACNPIDARRLAMQLEGGA